MQFLVNLIEKVKFCYIYLYNFILNLYFIEAFDGNDYNCFEGYLNVEKIIKDNKLYLRFEVDGTKLTADWEPASNYGVWQTSGYSGDDYSGYLLFPTYTDNRYFCLKYSC